MQPTLGSFFKSEPTGSLGEHYSCSHRFPSLHVVSLNIKDLLLQPFYSPAMKAEAPYFTGSQDSRSKPLWIDCAMEDSIRSTYLTTRGAYRSWRCLWNFPLHRWSVQKKRRRDEKKDISAYGLRNGYKINAGASAEAYSLSGGSRWAAGREGSCPSSRVIGSPARRPCRWRRGPGRFLHAPPWGLSTKQTPRDTAGGKGGGWTGSPRRHKEEGRTHTTGAGP